MDATFSERRSNVVSNSTVGNTAKSSGLRMYADTIITVSDKAILSEKKVSSIHGGMGRTMSASTAITSNGAVKPLSKPPLLLSHC